ncbi:IS66 family insertion sequence element accessory protein TnpB [Nibrella viscosa]|uniref:IS66 family insertion sequence element accessory protein TnpB n=1 Tax=Nibrella viscosa TaxID=1084524 RepID=A0ABP8KZ28_9BACT
MFSLSSAQTYLFYTAPCDMRKGIDGLCGLVRQGLQREPTSGEVFVFLNRSRTTLKLLHWEPGGFVLYSKRLEQGRFARPVASGAATLLRWPELVLMVEGIQLLTFRQKKRMRHPVSG